MSRASHSKPPATEMDPGQGAREPRRPGPRLDYERVFRYLLVGQHQVYGFPRVSAGALSAVEPHAPPDELRRYELFHGRFGPVQVAIPALCLLVTVKNFYFMYYAMSAAGQLNRSLDLDATATATANATDHDDVVAFGCLRASCRAKGLLMALPVFSLCHADLRPLYAPVADLHTNGLILYSVYALLLAVLGLCAPLYLNAVQVGHHLLMYLVAPATGRNLVRDDMRCFLAEIYASTVAHFARCPSPPDPQQTKAARVGQKAQACRRRSLGGPALTCAAGSPASLLVEREACGQLYLAHAKRRLVELERGLGGLGRPMRAFIDDAVTLFRADDNAYRPVVLRQYVLLAAFFVVNCLGATLACLTWAHHEMARRGAQLELIELALRRRNCSVWLAGDGQDRAAAAATAVLPLRWPAAPCVEVALAVAVIAYFGGTILTSFFTIAHELHNQIYEQLHRLDMVIELCHLTQHLLQLDQQPAALSGLDLVGANADRLANQFSFRALTRSIERELTTMVDAARLDPFGVLYRRRPDEAPPSQVGRRSAGELLASKGCSVGALLMLLHKIYCGNRALMLYTRRTSRNLATVLLFTILLNFLVIFAAILINNTFAESGLLPAVFACNGVLINTVIIWYPSKCQASSKRIIGLMWRLMAATVDFDDARVRHARQLYLKQLQVLCQEDGLTLSAYGVPVRYASLIKLFLWSSTLTVLAFNRDFRPAAGAFD